MSTPNYISLLHVGRRAPESEQLEFNWEPLDINKLTFPQGNIVCVFGGNNTNRAEESNGNAKIFESLISPKNRKKTHIFSFGYKTEPLKNSSYCSKEYIEETDMLFYNSFLPLILTKEGDLKKEQGIKEVFKRFVFASHCGGSFMANEIINKFYEVLLLKYPQGKAEQLISQIQYISYAPLEIPPSNVNSFIIAPLSDINTSWDKIIDRASVEGVDIDYPKNVTKKLIKSKLAQAPTGQKLIETMQDTRAIIFKIDNSTYIIPGPMNPRLNIGDHSIDCLAKKHILESGLDFAITAQLTRNAAKKYMNLFTSNAPYDIKAAFTQTANSIGENPPASEKTPLC